MNRLTKRENGKWQTTNKVDINYIDTQESVYVGNAIDKLAELEDFMEMCGYDNVETMAGDIGYMKGRIESQVTEIIDLKDHVHDLNNKLLNLHLFLTDLRDSFHKEDETYEEIDKKLKELGGR